MNHPCILGYLDHQDRVGKKSRNIANMIRIIEKSKNIKDKTESILTKSGNQQNRSLSQP